MPFRTALKRANRVARSVMSVAQVRPAYLDASSAAMPVPAQSSRNVSHGVDGREARKCLVFFVIAG
jgi:hypothetical protein